MDKRIHFLGLESRLEIIGCTVFFASAVFFSIFLLMAPDSIMTKPCSDCARWYYPVADNLANGRGLVVGDTDRPALDRPPGQVLLLSVVFRIGKLVGVEKVAMVYGYNVLLLSLAAYLLFLTSHLFWGIKGGLISAALWSSNPFTLWFLNQPFSEVPFFVCIYFSTWLFLRERRKRAPRCANMLAVGLALGFATLMRPIGIFLVVPVLCSLWLTKKRATRKRLLIASIAIIGGTWAALAPWQIFLFSQTGSVSIVSDGAHGHRSVVEGFIFGLRSEDYKAEIVLPPDVRRFMEGMHSTVFRYSETPEGVRQYGPDAPLDARKTENVVKIALSRLTESPGLMLRFFWLKISRSWYGTDSHQNEGIAMYIMMPYLVFCGLGLLQSIRDPRTRSLGVLVGLMTIYFWIFSIVFTPLVRYMIPALGLLLLAAPGIGHLNKGIKNGGLSSGQRN